jgi:hypothetical protein
MVILADLIHFVNYIYKLNLLSIPGGKLCGLSFANLYKYKINSTVNRMSSVAKTNIVLLFTDLTQSFLLIK